MNGARGRVWERRGCRRRELGKPGGRRGGKVPSERRIPWARCDLGQPTKPKSQGAGHRGGGGGESSPTSLCGTGGPAAPASAPPSEKEHREGASVGVVSPATRGSAAPVPCPPRAAFFSDCAGRVLSPCAFTHAMSAVPHEDRASSCSLPCPQGLSGPGHTPSSARQGFAD